MAVCYDIIAFDADDTLWHHEVHYSNVQERFRLLLAEYHSAAWIDERLDHTERRNLAHYGYGAKGFVLSLIETAIELTEGRITGAQVSEILEMGKSILTAPIEPMDGVRETLESLSSDYKLIIVTKGDLFDQESKIARSGFGDLFSSVEIVSEKDTRTYLGIMKRYGVQPSRFLMVGNSLRSDILPVLDAGADAVHIPAEYTWSLEKVSDELLHGRTFPTIRTIRELPFILG